MNAAELIVKKRQGQALSPEEIRFFVHGYVKEDIPDYQMSAFLMAVYFRGLKEEEATALTLAVADSGERLDLSGIRGVTADKHSTGGVGDKTTFIAGPIAACCGVKVAKMSGRGLGHTGGTLDKLAAIPGLRTSLTREAFLEIINQVGLCVAGQTADLAPADKKMYALRDVTGTVESLPLIAASVMGKKLAVGAECILLDVKAGSGAFMKTKDEAAELAQLMVRIGLGAGRKTMALITDMAAPLGRAAGNALEIAEAVRALRGEGPSDLMEISVSLAACMLEMARGLSQETARREAENALQSGRAYDKFLEMVKAQGGDIAVLRDESLLMRAAAQRDIPADESGYVARMDAELCGRAVCLLGAGRQRMDSEIDPEAGMYFYKKPGDKVEKGESLCRMYASREALFAPAQDVYRQAVAVTREKPEKGGAVLARVTKGAVQWL